MRSCTCEPNYKYIYVLYILYYLLRLIVAIVAYVVIGMIINATVRGARGVEMIPNLSFWKDFPYLLKVNSLYIMHSPALMQQ